MSANKPDQPTERETKLVVNGRVQFEELNALPSDLKVVALVFNNKGRQLGEGKVDAEGRFSVAVKEKSPFDGEIVLAPAGDMKMASGSTLYKQAFSRADWKGDETFILDRGFYLPKLIWWPWWPKKVCITGHVRKISAGPNGYETCPVPFVKVEVYDVDRESCWWPPIYRWWDQLLDKLVVRAEDLIPPRPVPPDPYPWRRPIPLPDPSPIALFDRRSRFERVGLNPQPLPPRELGLRFLNTQAGLGNPLDLVGLNPQPLPPGEIRLSDFDPQPEPPGQFSRRSLDLRQPAGAVSELSPNLTARLQKLTITSKIAPWLIFPGCFYSKAEVCETTTDCDGYFECCFDWFPWHFRKGRLRFDSTPDVILKVTQVVGGVETVIFMDPYTSTRWNVNNAHIDLFLDDPQVQCGSGCTPQPTGPATFFTLVGLDEVYKIDQASGKFSDLPYGGGLSNWAYGGNLLICGLFGTALSTGAPKRYYRLSFRKGANPWKTIQSTLSDTRVDGGFNTDIYTLGPQTVNGVPGLYEVRDTTNYLWYNPDKIGWWNTEGEEPGTGLYTLRLEVFNENGVKLTSSVVDYRDGTTPPPGPLPSMVDRCDLKILIDNQYPDLDLDIQGAGGDCGVVSCADRGSLAFDVFVSQPNNRLYYWHLWYVQGLGASSGTLDADSNGSGLATPVNQTILASPPFITTLETCAYSLTLGAWPLVRNGFGAIHWDSVTRAIAVEACP